MYNAEFEEEDTALSINFDYVSESTPLNNNVLSQVPRQNMCNDDTLSSTLLVEMKNRSLADPLPSYDKSKLKKVLQKEAVIEIGDHDRQINEHKNQTRNETHKKRALLLWQNTLNIDQLLIQIYDYYEGKGFKVILFQRLCSIFTVGFIVLFFLFLLNCIDYTGLLNPELEFNSRHRRLINFIHLNRILNLSFFGAVCILIFISYWLWQILKLLFEYSDLIKVREIYMYLLDIPDQDLATLSIQDIISKVIEINRKYPLDPSDMQLDPHDLRPPFSFVFGNQPMLTKTMEINLSICILQFVFDSNGHIRKKFVENVKAEELALELRKRFVIMAFMNFLASPFILAFLGVYFIFRYGEELYRNPKVLGTRQYTPYALWQFRELNELQAFFDERINRSYSVARTYTSLYPSHLVAIAAKYFANINNRFFGFVAGSLAFILILWGVLVEDLLLDLEITTGRTMLWYIGVLGVFVAFCRSLIPDETIIYKPEELLKEVTSHLRYLPSHWKNSLHTKMVRNEFSSLFHYKIAIFVKEMISVILTPIILCFYLPKCSISIINFFKDFSVHIDGLGYVCSFALFDFYRNGNPHYGCITKPKHHESDVYFQSEQGKMEKSFLNFKEKFPNWNPGPSGTMYLSRLMDLSINNKKAYPSIKILPPLRDISKSNSHPSKLGSSFPIRSVDPSILLQSDSLKLTPDDEYKLRITSSSSDDYDNMDEYSSDYYTEANIPNRNVLKSRLKGKKIISEDKDISNSSTLLDLMNKYINKPN